MEENMSNKILSTTAVAAKHWSCETVREWLGENGFSNYAVEFCDQHKIDGLALLALTEQDLRQPPLQLVVLGDIKRIMNKIQSLKEKGNPAGDGAFHNGSAQVLSSENDCSLQRGLSYTGVDFTDTSNNKRLKRLYSERLEPEYTKLIISFVYMFSVCLCTSLVMVVVHDRVPDTEKYPPLPDIVLDSMPLVPWAFQMCELTGLLLSTILFITLIFHKHRFIILRRLFSLTGTVFLLRCFTMLITSLSVPGRHLECEPKMADDMWSKLQRALVIWKGFGMQLQGVRTCGDYMFSGHTVVVTMLNFFITEYTPHWMHLLHTASWVLNLFGIFFILAAHEHYSIDVFIAFYITSRLFLYYHTLSNNRALRQPDHRRTRIWFPMFSFFECSVNGIVPNEYGWPLPWPKDIDNYFAVQRTENIKSHKAH